MIFSIIVAMSENHVIGQGNRLPWHLPEDLKRFKALTLGHPVIMGRKTFQSIGKVLPGRPNLIVTRQSGFTVPGATICSSIDEAVAWCRDNLGDKEEVFFIGGSEIYRQVMGSVDRIYLTVVHQKIEGDATFPEIPEEQFLQTSREELAAPIPLSFLRFERRR